MFARRSDLLSWNTKESARKSPKDADNAANPYPDDIIAKRRKASDLESQVAEEEGKNNAHPPPFPSTQDNDVMKAEKALAPLR